MVKYLPFRRFLLAFSFLQLSFVAKAQWTQSNGPGGGTIYSILANDSGLYVGASHSGTNSARVFYSTNSGASWKISDQGMPTSSGTRLIAAKNNQLFAVTGNGIYTSTNNAASWNLSSPLSAYGFAINGNSLFAAQYANVMFTSTDNGANWTQINTGMPFLNLFTLVTDAGVLFAGTSNGVYTSTTNGTSWIAKNTGITSQKVQSIFIDGSNWFIGTKTGGVFLSVNNGSTWSAMNTGLTNLDIRALIKKGNNLFVGTYGSGVFMSSNNGLSWVPVNTGLEYAPYIDVLITDGSNLIVGGAGGSEGLYISGNNGSAWTKTGLPVQIVNSFALNGNYLFAGTYFGGAFLSTDDAVSWKHVSAGLNQSSSIYYHKILSLISDSTYLFVGTYGGGIYTSLDSGSSWVAVNTALTSLTIRSLFVKGNNLFAGTLAEGVFLSTNRGANWVPVNTGLTYSNIKCFANDGNNLYVGTYGGGVFLSTDNGGSWTARNNGLNNQIILSLIANGGNLFAGTQGGGVFFSSDNGNNWISVNQGLANLTVATLLLKGNILIAGTDGGGVFFSDNNGGSWAAYNGGLTNKNVESLFSKGDNLIAGTTVGSVFYTPVNNITSVPSLTLTSINVLCNNGNSGSAQVVVSGGSLPYTYLWGNGATTPAISNIVAGTYSVNVSDANGLSLAQVVTITQPTLFSATVTSTAAQCYYDGAASSLATGGVSPYKYLWNNGATDATVSGLEPSSYSVAISDSNGCLITDSVFVGSNPTILAETHISSGLSCTSACDGSAFVIVSGGIPPYSYQWNNGSTTNTSSGICEGIYTTTITDSLGCIGFVQDYMTIDWDQINGPFGGRINCFATLGSSIFAGTETGVFLSNDYGNNWILKGLNNEITAFATIGSNLFASTLNGVFLSTDSGTTWSQVNTGLTNLKVSCLAVLGNSLFAGTLGGGAFLSNNNGETWLAINNGLSNLNIYSLSINGNFLLAGTFGSIYLTSDKGSNWIKKSIGLPYQKITSFIEKDGYSYAGLDLKGGIYKSNNTSNYLNTSGWSALKFNNHTVLSLASIGSYLFAGTDSGGVFLSVDNGNNWVPVNQGLSHPIVRSLLVKGGDLFAGTEGAGIFFSPNHGVLWQEKSSGLINQQPTSFLEIGTNLFVGTKGAGVFSSKDKGSTWLRSSSGLAGQKINSLIFTDNKVLAGTSSGIWMSADSGKSWNSIGLKTLSVLSIAMKGNMLIAGLNGYGIRISNDLGATWTSANTGLTNMYVNTIVVNDSSLFIGTNGGVFRYNSTSSSWEKMNNGLSTNIVYSLVVKNNLLFAGTFGGGIFISVDDGASWNSISNGLTSLFVSTLLVSNSHLIAVTSKGDLFISFNNGATWSILRTGLSDVKSIFLHNDVLFAGTSKGLFKSCGTPLSAYISGPTSFCKGANVQLDVGGGFSSYLWSTSDTTQSILVDTSGVYFVEISDCCGSAVVTTSVTMQDTLINLPGSNMSICHGKSALLTASGGDYYYWSPSTGLNSTIGATIIASPQSSITYTLTAGNACGTASRTFSVIVNPSPYITVSPDTTICNGDSLTIIASGALSFSWLPDSITGSMIKIMPTASTTYTVIGLDLEGCSDTRTVKIIVKPCSNNIIEKSWTENIEVYPNPSDGDLEIKFYNANGEGVRINIFSLEGRLLYTEEIIKITNNLKRINLKGLSPGIYLIELKNSEERKLLKLIIK